MLSIKDNFLETIRGGKPDRFVKQYEATPLLKGDPVSSYCRGGNIMPGTDAYDRWGTHIIWNEGEPGPVPDPVEKALEDIEEWEDVVKLPEIIANCDTEEVWAPFLERCAEIDRSQYLLTFWSPTGVFERLHFLMGFEDSLCNFLLEPELMQDLALAIAKNRLDGFKLMVKYAKPDLLLCHDDWGSKKQLFVSPDSWREIIKPAYVEGYKYLHDNGIIIMHHSDSFCEPIVQDMIDLHIDIWQGVLPQNDIVRLQKEFGGKIAFQGGIDAAIVDRDDSTEEEIRAEVRRACETYGKNGFFIPSITYGGPGCIHPHADEIINDEIDRCSERLFG